MQSLSGGRIIPFNRTENSNSLPSSESSSLLSPRSTEMRQALFRRRSSSDELQPPAQYKNPSAFIPSVNLHAFATELAALQQEIKTTWMIRPGFLIFGLIQPEYRDAFLPLVHGELRELATLSAPAKNVNVIAGQYITALRDRGYGTREERDLVASFLPRVEAVRYLSASPIIACESVPHFRSVLRKGNNLDEQIEAIRGLASAGPEAASAVGTLRSFLHSWVQSSEQRPPWKPYAIEALRALASIGTAAHPAMKNCAHMLMTSKDGDLLAESYKTLLAIRKSVEADLASSHPSLNGFSRLDARVNLFLALAPLRLYAKLSRTQSIVD